MISLNVKYVEKGVVFDSAMTSKIIDRFITGAEKTVGDVAVNLIKQRLHSVLQHPTGHYESQIQTSNMSTTLMVTDGNVVYGPWLEGASSRNTRTRFKGYSTFRRIGQQLQNGVDQLIQSDTSRMISELNQ